MAIDGKYGKIEIPGIRDDEPVFIIRGQDRSAYDAVCAYGSSASAEGASNEFVDSVRARAREIRDWQDDNDDLLKIPD